MTSQSVQVEAVPRTLRREALRYLAGGGRMDLAAELRAEAFEGMIQRSEGRWRLCWARRGGRCVAAALVVASPGRTGTLFHSSDSPGGSRGADGLGRPGGAEADPLRRVVGEVSRQALAGGLSLVQSLVPPGRERDALTLTAAGYTFLAELAYMNRSLARVEPAEADGSLVWRRYGEFDEPDLARIIEGTYAGSLDCPALCGLRKLPDVIAGHKASGVFRPDSWWLVEADGTPAGCILLNDSAAHEGVMEVVYMGVVPPFRGRGLGRAMIRRAVCWAARHGRTALSLAADTRNVYACRIYAAEGFRQIDRRTAYMICTRSVDAARG